MMFKDLKAGDTVLRYKDLEILRGGWGAGLSKRIIVAEVVARVTPTQAVTESDLRFSRKDGTVYRNNTSGFRGGVYPVGYERPAGIEGPAAKLCATPAERIQELETLAATARAFSQLLIRIDKRGHTRVLSQAIRTLGEQQVTAAMTDCSKALEALLSEDPQ
jgi:hypothetical protein